MEPLYGPLPLEKDRQFLIGVPNELPIPEAHIPKGSKHHLGPAQSQGRVTPH